MSNRILISLLAFFFFGIAVASADDNTRAAQARLKEGGFYFGQVNGVYDSDTAAAITRYQIRNGLQISGKLDAATARALGVASIAPAAPTSPLPRAESETWRRLRKSDKQFLEKLNAGKIAPPKSPAATAPPVAATVPAAESSPSQATLVLSQERLRDYVGAFVRAGLDPKSAAELEFFADRVNYYDQGMVSRERIRSDLQSYARRWPHRTFWFPGEVQVAPQADSRLSVTFLLGYELRNGSKHASGKIVKTLLLEVTADDLRIVAVNEREAR